MAVTYTKEPTGIYPGYNDSYLEFSSDLLDNNKAEITVYPVETFINPFIVYPDQSGNFLFNLKEAAKVLFNELGFNDSNYFTDSYSKTIQGIYKSISIKVTILSDEDSEENFKTYNFFKGIQQIGELSLINNYSVLNNSKDNVNYDLTYFEGFPFSFDLLNISQYEALTIKNKNTGQVSDPFPHTGGTVRVNIDRGESGNWISDNILPLTDNLNRLEVYGGATFRANLNIFKKDICSGIYLKWFNSRGGYSHFLFSQHRVIQTKGKDIRSIINSDFKNIGESVGFFDNVGKEASSTVNVNVKYNQKEYETLKDLLLSPSVQIYTENEKYKNGKFVNVRVNGSFTHSTKRQINDARFSIELPEIITAKL